MDKRAKLRLGIFFVLIIITLLFVFYAATSYSFYFDKDVYELGEKVKFDLREYDDYKIRLETPDNIFIIKGSRGVEVFNPDKTGFYKVSIETNDELIYKQFDVVNKIEGNNESEILETQLDFDIYSYKEKIKINSIVNNNSVTIEKRGDVVRRKVIKDLKEYGDYIFVEHNDDLEIVFDENEIEPGKYLLEYETSEGIFETEFYLGVFAFNFDKSVYISGDKGLVSMAVLNDFGEVVCNAEVNIIVDKPNGSDFIYNADIIKSDDCVKKGYSSNPDYYFYYSFDEIGEYGFNINVKFDNVERNFTEKIRAVDKVIFDVRREGATRLYPLNYYEMKIKINANEDYYGKIVEKVPASFDLIVSNANVYVEDDTKIIEWDVDFTSGNSYELNYMYDAPDKSPDFFSMGPLEIGNFVEERRWQLANDVIFLGEFYLFWNGTSFPSGWSCVSCGTGGNFQGRFIRGAATYGTIGGNETHSHTLGYVSETSGGGETVRGQNTPVASQGHTHGALSGQTVNSVSNYPLYNTLNVIKYDAGGIPSVIPKGAIAIFNSSSLPSNWTRYSLADNRFPFANGTANLNGGSNTHNHTFSTGLGSSTGTVNVFTGAGVNVASAGHTHPVATGGSNVSGNVPEYIDVVLAYANENVYLPYSSWTNTGLIAMFNSSVPGGWSSVSGSGGAFNGKFIRGAATYGSTGGNNNNTHANANINVQATASTIAVRNSVLSANAASSSHVHQVTVNFTSNSNLPPYIDVIFAYAQSDFEPPNITLNFPTPGYGTKNGNIIFNVTVLDNANLKNVSLWGNWSGTWKINETNSSGLNGVNYYFNKTLSDGNYIWGISACDLSGNCNYSQNRTLSIDSTAPLVTIITPLSKNYSQSFMSFNLSLNEQGSACWYTLDNGINNKTMSSLDSVFWNATNTSIGEGDYIARFYCNDSANNIGNASIGFGIDTIFPSLNLFTPSNINYTNNNISINYSVSDSKLQTCFYSLNGGFNITLSGCFNSSFIFNQGWNNFTIYANDSAGNLNHTNRTFFVDSIKPQISYGVETRPNGTSWEFDWIYVDVSLIETNFANITYDLYNETGGGTLVNRTTFYSQTLNINWTELNNNFVDYYYNVTVYDILGNLNYTETRTLTLTSGDIQGPVLTIISPENENYTYSSSTVYFNVTSDEIASYCDYSLNNGENNISMSSLNGVNWNATNTSIDDGKYNIDFYCEDSIGNPSSYERDFRVDTTAPNLSNVQFFALDKDKNIIGDESYFNSSNLIAIEYMKINFTLSDEFSLNENITFYYAANGTNPCALGNNQSSVCYSYTDFIEFINGSITTTFDGDNGNLGDSIDCSYYGSDNERNYTCIIDEHYNPNVWKHYPFNFSNVSWQSGTNERIMEGNLWKISINSSLIPDDADIYKFDFRVNYSSVDIEDLEVYLCNDSYLSGNPHDNINCRIVAKKSPSEIINEKFRFTLARSVIEEIGGIAHVILESEEETGYYSMKTYDYIGAEKRISYISNDDGQTFDLLSDKYESEFNVNWFYYADTGFVIKVFEQDIVGNNDNSSEYYMNWNLDYYDYTDPIVDIFYPANYQNISENYSIKWQSTDQDGNNFTTSIYLINSTGSELVFSGIFKENETYEWNSHNNHDGFYNLTVVSCENNAIESDLGCGNYSVEIKIDNTHPYVEIVYPQNMSYVFVISSLNYTVYDLYLYSCRYSLDDGQTNISINCGQNVTGLSANQGWNNWTVYAKDFVNSTYGNENYSKVEFYVDSIIPIINNISDDPDPVINGTLLNITANVTDNLIIGRVWVEIEGTNYTLNYLNGDYYNISINTSIYSIGYHNYTVYANDSLGNNAITLNGTFRNVYDYNIPIINSASDDPDPVSFSRTFNITANVTDDTSVSDVWVEIKGVNYTLSFISGNIYGNDALSTLDVGVGNFNYTVYATDTSGYEATPLIGDITIIEGTFVNNISVRAANPDPIDWDRDGYYAVVLYNPTNQDVFVTQVNISASSSNAVFAGYTQGGTNSYPQTGWTLSGNKELRWNGIYNLSKGEAIGFFVTVTSNKIGETFTMNYEATIDGTLYKDPHGHTTTESVVNGIPFVSLAYENNYPGYNETVKGNTAKVFNISMAEETGRGTIGTGVVLTIEVPEGFYNIQSNGGTGWGAATISGNTINVSNTATVSNGRITYSFNATAPAGTAAQGLYIMRAYLTGTNARAILEGAVKVFDGDPPSINLEYPFNYQNITGWIVKNFSYNVTDASSLTSCNLWGNWSGIWQINQTQSSPQKNVIINFSSVNISNDGFFIWNVRCTDQYGNQGFNSSNWTFGAFEIPGNTPLRNATMSRTDGTGNVTLYWNSAAHGFGYRVYRTSDLKNSFVLVNVTSWNNWTDSNFNGNRRMFYMIESINPVASTNGTDYFSAHVYTLKHNGNSKNWIGMPTNVSYLRNANDSLYSITNATSFSMWNATTQKKVTCNKFLCPSFPSCTDESCNFNLEPGRGYEVNINLSAPVTVNWSMVGVLYNSFNFPLKKNDTDFGKNWISIYGNTTLVNAQGLYGNISNADAVSMWNETSQTSLGLIDNPFPFGPQYLGSNFPIEMERGYEISVTANSDWNQI